MTRRRTKLRRYHAAQWNEPIITELSFPGRRGITVPQVDPRISRKIGNSSAYIPPTVARKANARLPELSQPEVLRHYLRLSQQTQGNAVSIDLGLGTDTMKYSPIVNEELVRSAQVSDIHPFQDEETVQGLLEIIYRFSQFLSEISGMHEFTFQPGGGAQAIYTNACIIRKWHEMRGEQLERDEIITTVFSHPANAAAPATAGFNVITLFPDPDTGLPDTEGLKAAVSKHTAGLMMTNPEDTGIYNPKVDEFVKIVHEAGGLCAYDQANANPLFGIARARDAGFDMCHFNLHKSFSSPHASMGPACGAAGVTEELAEFLPVPRIAFDGSKYRLRYDGRHSIGKIRQFQGNIPKVVRSYAWVMSLGADGLRQVSETAVMNNNYLIRKLAGTKGVGLAYPRQRIRLEEARFSLQQLKDDTGVTTEDVARRMSDYGVMGYFTSHHPWIVREPFIPEATETFCREDIDLWCEIIRKVCEEAYSNPELVRTAPHNQGISRINEKALNEPREWAMTWRAFVRKHRRK